MGNFPQSQPIHCLPPALKGKPALMFGNGFGSLNVPSSSRFSADFLTTIVCCQLKSGLEDNSLLMYPVVGVATGYYRRSIIHILVMVRKPPIYGICLLSH